MIWGSSSGGAGASALSVERISLIPKSQQTLNITVSSTPLDLFQRQRSVVTFPLIVVHFSVGRRLTDLKSRSEF